MTLEQYNKAKEIQEKITNLSRFASRMEEGFKVHVEAGNMDWYVEDLAGAADDREIRKLVKSAVKDRLQALEDMFRGL